MKTIFICLFTMVSVTLYAQTLVLSDSTQFLIQDCLTVKQRPLYVLNNKILSCDSVHFLKRDDIIEIQVLKGASASALYGPVAGLNGAVIFTTKQYAALQKKSEKKSPEIEKP